MIQTFTKNLPATVFAGVCAIAVGALAITGAPTAAQADNHDHAHAKVGEAAPDFTLTDLEGNEHTLSEYTEQGKIVVLEWFSPDCPFVVKHYADTDNSTMNAIAADYKDDNVVVLAINSAEPNHSYANPARNLERHEEWAMTHPILADSDGKVGHMYAAKVTPHMYIICQQGVLRYAGAIDNDRSPRSVGDVNFVRQALDEMLAGETVSTPETRAYGCSVKYKK